MVLSSSGRLRTNLRKSLKFPGLAVFPADGCKQHPWSVCIKTISQSSLWIHTKKMGSQGCISTIASFSSRASVSPSSSGTCTFFHSCSACSPASPECAGTAFHVTRQWIWFGNWARLKITQPGKKCFAEEKAAKLRFDSLSLLLGQWRERACDYERWSVQFGWCETWRI